jgi:hypothetical protein
VRIVELSRVLRPTITTIVWHTIDEVKQIIESNIEGNLIISDKDNEGK